MTTVLGIPPLTFLDTESPPPPREGLIGFSLGNAEKVDCHSGSSYTSRRKEVVFVTTTQPNISTHSHEPEATEAPGAQAAQTRRSRFIFAGVLLIASFATGLALFFAGSGGTYGFVGPAALIIGFFNVAIMIYPLAQARAHRAQFWVRFWIALAAVITGFLGTFITFWVASLMGGSGNALNYALGAVAIILNASAAFMLAWIKTAQRSTIPDLEARLEVASVAKARLLQEWSSAQAQVTTRTESRDLKKASWEADHEAAKAAERRVKKAQKTLDKSEVSKDLDEANKAHPLAQQALADHLAEMAEDKRLKKSGVTAEIRDNAASRLAEMEGLLPDKEQAVQEAEDRMKQAKKAFEASPELARLKQRTEESIAANEHRDAGAKLLAKEEKRLADAVSNAAEKGDLHGKQSAEVTRLSDELETARRNDVSIWRDVVAGPVFALVLAFWMYPNWYIWVITTVGAPNL